MTFDNIIFLIALSIFIIVLYFAFAKKIKSTQFIEDADKAIMENDDAKAINILKVALVMANENPEKEKDIVQKLDNIYKKHKIDYSFENYLKLVEQYQFFSKRSSTNVLELADINNVKSDVVKKMPNLE